MHILFDECAALRCVPYLFQVDIRIAARCNSLKFLMDKHLFFMQAASPYRF